MNTAAGASKGIREDKKMKAIMVMYDSLNRHLLEPYGCDWTKNAEFQAAGPTGRHL